MAFPKIKEFKNFLIPVLMDLPGDDVYKWNPKVIATRSDFPTLTKYSTRTTKVLGQRLDQNTFVTKWTGIVATEKDALSGGLL